MADLHATTDPHRFATVDPRTPSFVYVIASDAGPVKVGFSQEPRVRLTHLQIATHHELALRFQLPLCRADAFAVERHTHWLLRNKALGGEWFDVTVAAAATAIKDAWRAIQGGQYRDDHIMPTLGMPSRDSLSRLIIDGKIDQGLYRAGLQYRRLALRTDRPLSRAVTAEVMVDASLKVERIDDELAERFGLKALALIRGCLIHGHSLRSFPRLRPFPAWRTVAAALVIVERGIDACPEL